MKKIIYLQGIGTLKKEILFKLKKNLEWTFKGIIKSVKISKKMVPLKEKFYNPIRKQYNGSYILKNLKKEQKISEYLSILGVLEDDIYSRYFNFIFGVAEKPFLNHSGIALISVSRLREDFYKRPNNDALFELRVLKEALHELGHTFGLLHCKNECIMRFSNSLADTDKKPPIFCDKCKNQLDLFFNLN